MKNRLTALLLALLLVVSVLSGCGKKQEQSEKSGVVSLHTLSILGDSGRSEVYAELLMEFTQDKPQVYLRDITAVPADAFKLNVTLESTYRTTDAPHIVYYYTDTGINELHDEFITINEIKRQYPDFASGVSEQALAAANDGKTTAYCVPAMGTWSAVAVNTALLEQCGATIPDDWDGLLAAIDILSGSDIIPFANPADDCSAIVELLVAAYGGEAAVTTGVQRDTITLKQAWIPALERFGELCAVGAFAPAAVTDTITEYAPEKTDDVSDSDAQDNTSGSITQAASGLDLGKAYSDVLGERDVTRPLDAIELFNSGKAAMIMLDSSQMNQITVETTQLCAFPSPDDAVFATGGIMINFREGFYITRNAFDNPETRDLVVQFVDQLTNAHAAELYAGLGYFPASSSVEDADVSAIAALAGELPEWQSTTRIEANTPFWTKAQQYAGELQYGVITPQLMAELLTDATLDTGELLDAMRTQNPPADTTDSGLSE